MMFSFLVTLREGFEIALIVAIVFGYLARTGATWAWTGAGSISWGVRDGAKTLVTGGMSGIARFVRRALPAETRGMPTGVATPLRGILLVVAVGVLFPSVAYAGDPKSDLQAANSVVRRAIAAADRGDITEARREYRAYENNWFEIEDGIREVSREAYRVIEKRMTEVSSALAGDPPRVALVRATLAALDAEQLRFIAGEPPLGAAGGAAPVVRDGASTISVLLEQLQRTQAAVRAGDVAAASAAFEQFSAIWLDVEGEVKTRSADDYRATENDMARVTTALSRQSPEALSLLDGMAVRLEPYENAGNYRAFDAMIIVLREGLEALLVVVALLAFVRKSGNADKDSWVWGGAAAGLVASIVLGVAINALLGKAFSGEHRELLEGVSGLVAAAMLLYVSYWLHSKSLLGAWERHIGEQTTRALARGSLVGLAVLSFLAVFREGGETVLFLLGLSGRITTENLLLGLGVGFAVLAIVGVLLTIVGLRIPMRPFFRVTSVLTFYLCFKFVGAGIHALQVANVVSARTASFLPTSDTFGLFPSWQTTVPQAALLLVGLVLVTRTVLRDRADRRR